MSDPLPGRLRRYFDQATQGLRQDELRRLFDREAGQAYRVLTRDAGEDEPAGGLRRLFHRLRLLFLGISNRLTPARRILFVAALLGLLLALFDIDVSGTISDRVVWSVDVSPFFFILGFGCLLFLFALELVDRVRVRDELEVARALQADLLPDSDPELPGFRVAHSYRPANEVGGDCYDFLPLAATATAADGERRVALLVGDASGHGIAAGLVMAIGHATVQSALDVDPACSAVMAMTNRAILRTGDRRTFMSLFFGLLDPATGELEHASAGHPYPLLRRADGRLEELELAGYPLGISERLAVPTRTVTLGPGDLLVLYSDGLPEALGADGTAFGFDRLAALVAEGGTPQQLHDRITGALDRHLGEEALADDFTLVVLERGVGGTSRTQPADQPPA